MYTQLQQQLGWFRWAGVDRFNFSVLIASNGRTAMLADKLPKPAAEVMYAAGWAWANNKRGLDVYLRPATGPAWPVIILDDLPTATALAIARKYSALVYETSANNCHAWIAIKKPLSITDRRALQERLAALIGADAGSKSGDHFGRAAGFHNRKPGRHNYVVEVRAETRGLLLDHARVLTVLPPHKDQETGGGGPTHACTAGDGVDYHVREYAFACHRLRGGWTHEQVEDAIRQHVEITGRRKPKDYPARTVAKAAATIRR